METTQPESVWLSVLDCNGETQHLETALNNAQISQKLELPDIMAIIQQGSPYAWSSVRKFLVLLEKIQRISVFSNALKILSEIRLAIVPVSLNALFLVLCTTLVKI